MWQQLQEQHAGGQWDQDWTKLDWQKQNNIEVNLDAGFDKTAFVRAILLIVAVFRDSSHRSLRSQGRLGHGGWLARRLFGQDEGHYKAASRVATHAALPSNGCARRFETQGGLLIHFGGTCIF